MASEKILNRAPKFIALLRQQGTPVEMAYLFGSWAQGNATEWSDIDIAVVSPVFEGKKFYDRRKLDRAVVAVDTAIEAHPYRPQDFIASNPFVREILKTGIRLV